MIRNNKNKIVPNIGNEILPGKNHSLITDNPFLKLNKYDELTINVLPECMV